MTAPKLDDATPFPWLHIRRPARAKTIRRGKDAIPTEEMQAVAVALFGECKTCRALLDIDGTCPAKSTHEKHVCPDCGAESADALSVAQPCLFENEHGRAAE